MMNLKILERQVKLLIASFALLLGSLIALLLLMVAIVMSSLIFLILALLVFCVTFSVTFSKIRKVYREKFKVAVAPTKEPPGPKKKLVIPSKRLVLIRRIIKNKPVKEEEDHVETEEERIKRINVDLQE